MILHNAHQIIYGQVRQECLNQHFWLYAWLGVGSAIMLTKHEEREHERMDYIAADAHTFFLKTWLPLSVVIFWIVISVNWIRWGDWDLKTVGLVVLQMFTAIPLFYLIRYFVSGFADGVWVDDESILFKKDGKTEKTSLENIEEMKSSYCLWGAPFNSRQYLVRIKFSEPIGIGETVRFFLQSHVGKSGSDKAVLENLVERIKKYSL